MESVEDKNKPKSAFKFHCEFCDYITCKKSNYDNHTSSDKHKRITKELQMGQKEDKNKLDIFETFVCSCGKQYKHRQGLWKHKKKCSNNKESDKISESTVKETEAKELIQYLLKENSEFKQLMIDQNKQMLTGIQEQNKNMLEIAKNSGNNNNNSNNNNNNNNNNNSNIYYYYIFLRRMVTKYKIKNSSNFQ
jgi:hypothetical protein